MQELEKFQWEVYEMAPDLLDIAEHAVRKAEELGAEQAEVYISSSKSFGIKVENSAIKSATEKNDIGCGIRSVVSKKVGFAYVTNALEQDILEAVTKSVKLAKVSVADPDFVTFPSFEGAYPKVDDLVDPDIRKLTSEEAADLVVRIVDAAQEAIGDLDSAIEAELATGSGTRVIMNSLGISGTYSSTSISIVSYPTIKTENEQTSGYEYGISRRLKDINPEQIGNNSGSVAVQNLGGKKIEGGDLPVIVDPLAAGWLIGRGFGAAINAEEVQYGRSYIMDVLGDDIASQELHIIDNGLLPGGVGSRVFDAEGVPSQETEIIESGVLKSLLHNSYTANKDNVENTGNASRPSYSGIPSISPSNFIISPGKGKQEDLVSEMKEGVLCRTTYDRPNFTTGDLSAMIMEGYYIKDGEIQHSLKNTLMGINMRDMLQRINRVAADSRVTANILSPSLVIKQVKITSG
jgi:PmbA protein